MTLRPNKKDKRRNNNRLFGNPRLMRFKKLKSNIKRLKRSESRCILKEREIHGATLKQTKTIRNNPAPRNDFYSSKYILS